MQETIGKVKELDMFEINSKTWLVGEHTIVMDKITFITNPKKLESDKIEHITHAIPNFWKRIFRKWLYMEENPMIHEWIEPEGGCRYTFEIGLTGGEYITCREHKDTIFKWYRELLLKLK